jgi:hypothetical protein
VAYHSATGREAGRFANPPIELPNDYDAVRRALDHVTRGEQAVRA